MARTGVGCRLVVDGVRLFDGCEGVYDGVTVESGLSISWGRDNTVDQPSSSTCTFVLTDDTDSAAYVSAIRIGSYVEVFADGVDPDAETSPPVEAFTDGGFEAGVNGWAASTSSLEVTTERAVEGVQSAAVGDASGAGRWSATFAPAPLEPNTGGNPAAWDAVPTTRGGNTWTIGMSLWLPAGVPVTVTPALFSAPWASAVSYVTGAAVTVGPVDTSGWTAVEFEFVPTEADRWVGFRVAGVGGITWASAAAHDDWTWEASPYTDLAWGDLSTINVDAVSILAPAVAVVTSRLVFAGRVTDLEVSWDDSASHAAADVTAVDILADLANRYVGDEPWPLESAETRMLRVVELAAEGNDPITVDYADTLADIPVSWVDVDRQAAAGLLEEIARSVDGVLWSATHIVTGPYIRLEDPAARLPMFRLELEGGLIVIVPIDYSGVDASPYLVSACDVLRDPVTFLLDVADVVTSSTVNWKRQAVDEDGNPAPEDAAVNRTDVAAVAQYGTRSASVSTILAAAYDAGMTAERLLQRLDGSWRIEGVTVDDAEFVEPNEAAAALLIAILGGVERGGLPLIITDLPSWSPVGAEVPIYLEGGTYSFVDGGWSCDLVVSRATGFGSSAAWDDLDPAWVWNSWAPALTWDDLRGAAGPTVDPALNLREAAAWAV